MAQALGIGGIFFRTADPEGLAAWYQEHLGIPLTEHGMALFSPDTMPAGSFTLWSPFKQDTDYFGDKAQGYMINLIVDDLESARQQVKQGGAELIAETEHHEYGSFGWFIDPAGNRVELWQPPASPQSS